MNAAPDRTEDSAPREETAQVVWHWFAIGLLVICWIAEAAMCADRGF